MKRILILLFFFASNFIVYAQASWNTKFAFILRNDDNEAIKFDEFKESYKLIDVSGRIISNDQLTACLTFDENTNYFILDIETIGPRFSFALLHNNNIMIIYLPFVHEKIYFAVDIEFRTGKFLFDFDIKNKENIYFKSNIPHYVINKINWKNQSKKLKESTYSNDETYDKFKN
jgi:hypothetical protein